MQGGGLFPWLPVYTLLMLGKYRVEIFLSWTWLWNNCWRDAFKLDVTAEWGQTFPDMAIILYVAGRVGDKQQKYMLFSSLERHLCLIIPGRGLIKTDLKCDFIVDTFAPKSTVKSHFSWRPCDHSLFPKLWPLIFHGWLLEAVALMQFIFGNWEVINNLWPSLHNIALLDSKRQMNWRQNLYLKRL